LLSLRSCWIRPAWLRGWGSAWRCLCFCGACPGGGMKERGLREYERICKTSGGGDEKVCPYACSEDPSRSPSCGDGSVSSILQLLWLEQCRKGAGLSGGGGMYLAFPHRTCLRDGSGNGGGGGISDPPSPAAGQMPGDRGQVAGPSDHGAGSCPSGHTGIWHPVSPSPGRRCVLSAFVCAGSCVD